MMKRIVILALLIATPAFAQQRQSPEVVALDRMLQQAIAREAAANVRVAQLEAQVSDLAQQVKAAKDDAKAVDAPK